ncbi:MAG: hypothetical protein ABJL33_14810 [Hyphomicrobiales bacterium]
MEARLDEVLFSSVSARTFFAQVCASPQLMTDAITLANRNLTEAPDAAQVSGPSVSGAGGSGRERHSGIAVGAVPQKPSDTATLPASADLRQAEQIADRTGVALPDKASRDATVLAAWIRAHEPTTRNQMNWITKLVERRKIAPPEGYPDQVTALQAKTFLGRQLGARRRRGNDPRAVRPERAETDSEKNKA